MATSDALCVTALDMNPVQSAIKATLGALVVGGLLQALFFGVLLVHTALYYFKFNYTVLDFYRLDCGHLVCALLILNSLEVVMDFHVVYRTAVTLAQLTHSEDYCTLFDHQIWTMWLQPGVEGTIGCLAQAFFLNRCWRTTNKLRVVAPVLSFCIILSLGSGFAVTVTAFQRKSLIAQITQTSIPMSLWLASTVAANLAIASLVFADLLNAKTSSSFKRPSGEGGVLRRIVQLPLETGVMSAVLSVLNLVLYFAEKGTAYHLIPQYCLSRIYAISVLVALLARRVPDRDAAAPYGSFSLSGPMERTVSKLEVKINKVVESDHPDGSVTGTDPGSGVDTKTIWSPSAV
ncbi:putative Transmembrane protein [Mycena venus]|uniref:Putative Transmembrane protein n=1 Tax=Mycena venus TaxID=2733690 RepID=A0A8H6XMZ7_9AGAR|nr:putative Transmembrane protein [Mycena venus]